MIRLLTSIAVAGLCILIVAGSTQTAAWGARQRAANARKPAPEPSSRAGGRVKRLPGAVKARVARFRAAGSKRTASGLTVNQSRVIKTTTFLATVAGAYFSARYFSGSDLGGRILGGAAMGFITGLWTSFTGTMTYEVAKDQIARLRRSRR